MLYRPEVPTQTLAIKRAYVSCRTNASDQTFADSSQELRIRYACIPTPRYIRLRISTEAGIRDFIHSI